MHNGKDNRLTVEFLATVLAKALDIVEKDWRTANGEASGGSGALIISGKQDQEKFFSNGSLVCSLLRQKCAWKQSWTVNLLMSH